MKLRRILLISSKCKHLISRSEVCTEEQANDYAAAFSGTNCPKCQSIIAETTVLWDDKEYAANDEPVVGDLPLSFINQFRSDDQITARARLLASGARIPVPQTPTREDVIRGLKAWGYQPTQELIAQQMKPIKPQLEDLLRRIYLCFQGNISEKLQLIPVGERKGSLRERQSKRFLNSAGCRSVVKA